MQRAIDRPVISSLPTVASDKTSFSWWGMAALIVTEAMVFGALFASYFYLRYRHGVDWPPDGIEDPRLPLVLVMTAILWSSSIPMHIADKGIRQGSQTALRTGLLASFVLGAAFIVLIIAIEYPEILDEFTPRTNSYGSLFFTITGLHGLHVIAGLMLIAWTAARGFAGHFDEQRHMTVRNVAMYWHFVDLVWAFVLATLYLSPHL